MFSLDRFYNIIHNNLISRLPNGRSIHFYPFGTYNQRWILSNTFDYKYIPDTHSDELARQHQKQSYFHSYFFDQEPFFNETIAIADKTLITHSVQRGPNQIKLFANSEHSQLVTDFCKDNYFYNWYYFFHGFAALDWYKDFQYVNSDYSNQFDKVFICYNNLLSKYRSYRLHLVANLIEQDLLQYGKVSLQLQDNLGTWKQTIADPENPLDKRARFKVYNAFKDLNEPLVIDTNTPSGSLSAKVDLDDLTSALFHVVTETIYFQDKLHLTEKVFKPIIARRPFFLVAAPGNLAYLKRYGFKTFDRWIDESYDNETDHYMRIERITAELARLCAMSKDQLEQMYVEMQEVLDYNFDHFYGDFKHIIVDELVDNFEGVLNQINNGRIPGNHSKFHQRYELDPAYLAKVKRRLAS